MRANLRENAHAERRRHASNRTRRAHGRRNHQRRGGACAHIAVQPPAARTASVALPHAPAVTASSALESIIAAAAYRPMRPANEQRVTAKHPRTHRQTSCEHTHTRTKPTTSNGAGAARALGNTPSTQPTLFRTAATIAALGRSPPAPAAAFAPPVCGRPLAANGARMRSAFVKLPRAAYAARRMRRTACLINDDA